MFVDNVAVTAVAVARCRQAPPIRHQLAPTVVDLPTSQAACRVGRSTTVCASTWTATDPPPFHAHLWWLSGHLRRDLPDDGRSTTTTRR